VGPSSSKVGSGTYATKDKSVRSDNGRTAAARDAPPDAKIQQQQQQRLVGTLAHHGKNVSFQGQRECLALT